ncbi:spore coat protein [Candidatus Woesebacteria bacterium RIFCSPLOWO2_01_FULL_39_61]|uniref:glucose-1-phosphate thymidylyltransferase n=1 Tax=Candidatus Woesebacteria bacterium RIFCSPHIGHO2_02_FULL_39_13 TaxID=1802505 RepID=A0A1F7Z4Z8_9BACT|nr:MAG: spore coat protein [Candidatus Woesebacteria bacterium RIFCSPHIGHO2_01_FULL_39_95]OGM33815.1 MAG: spore coat protein [Candidatus Woesebacteria bacterium RIFCSPHIGHO2_02_FULL_39_13]OGM38976.1 MAG: spore coat protein [Candidatus Woesebacteria bacterium RIFCSPHIGHO2_12_FULL_40_20]OGM65624.1 MAG: spore coat protein [Candidatus Woesebacteria bacterium RIFCSPLOWO2_01_FULL_39_61]OGM72812.1 MAG: spore coat protein [Candidatus Woesebacteria bacterium RIFCSPLOWO2_12_FULL_39_9]
MKGIILAGGSATRLRPLTKITSKQLLPVYDQPMIYYPIQTLVSSGITDILIIISPQYSGQFLNLLGSGKEFGARFSYAIQEEPKGLADAFIVGEDFIDNDNVTMILGDNIFDNHGFAKEIKSFKSGAMVFAKKVTDPERFGVVEFDEEGKVLSIVEKPKESKSDYAVVGLYTYDSRVIKYAKSLKPSARGEIEITDLNNLFLKKGELKVNLFEGLWADAGTFDSLLEVSNYMANKALNAKK